MPDDTNTAIQALIEQVTKLTETVDAQAKRLDDLREFNGRVLDEKKDLQRKIEKPSPELIAEMDKAGLELGPNGKDWYPKGTKPSHTLTRAEARDPRRYHAAKQAASKAGATLQIVDEAADQHRRSSRTPTDTTLKTTLVTDDHSKVAYLRRDEMKDSRQYQGLRAQGFVVQSWDTKDDLPPHMQTKLQLMERAHDAD